MNVNAILHIQFLSMTREKVFHSNIRSRRFSAAWYSKKLAAFGQTEGIVDLVIVCVRIVQC